MSDDRMYDHILQIHEGIADIKASVQSINTTMSYHQERLNKLEEDSEAAKDDVAQAKGTLKAIKWAIGLLMAIPSTIYAMIKLSSSP